MEEILLLRISSAVVLIWVILVSAAISAEKKNEKETLKVGDQAPKFTLKDADDNEYILEKILSKEKKDMRILLLIIGDHTTRGNGNKWAKELDKLYKERKVIDIFMIADLRKLPFFVTEFMVKWGTKREGLPVTILLDWEGKVSQQYKTQRGESNIFIVDSDGKIRYILVGQCSPENLKILQSKIQENIKGKKNGQPGISK
jgi:peroxiredoxin